LWDIFCRVIDNFGDIGVCWRLAADLASRGEQVRLWVDDASALRWMAPQGAPGVSVRAWNEAAAEPTPGDVVIEAFGCELPAPFVERMAAASRPPVWVNLEYLSAEAYVDRSHGLLSPQRNGLRKWFFYPGFTAATGGLIREPGLIERLDTIERDAWLAQRSIDRQPDERVVTVFSYANPALEPLIEALADQPTVLLLAGHYSQRMGHDLLGPTLQRGALRAFALAPMPQPDFDALLVCSDLNFVRGEDSFVRAQWAGRPFVWQLYPQDDATHAIKLDAFLDRYLAGCPAPLSQAMRPLFLQWNGLTAPSRIALPHLLADWQRHTLAWRAELQRQTDLTGQLLRFATEKGQEAG
jgi:uncharacterized repeat protein (TIGR03837 family)